MKQPDTSRCTKGFTLVELMLVLVIVAVVGAIAVPRFAQATARQQLDAAAERVVADIDEARIRSRAASQSVTMTFDTASNSYSLDAVGGEAINVALDQAPYGAIIKEANFGGSAEVIFNGYGVPLSAGYVDLSSSVGTFRVTLTENGRATR